MRADIHDGPEHTLQAEAGYIDARPLSAGIDESLLQRAAGPYIGSDGNLYCVAQDEVVAFDFATGKSLGPVVRLPGLNGQAVIFFG